MITRTLYLVAQTTWAYKFRIPHDAYPFSVWLPKSQIKLKHVEGRWRWYQVSMPRTLAEDKELL